MRFAVVAVLVASTASFSRPVDACSRTGVASIETQSGLDSEVLPRPKSVAPLDTKIWVVDLARLASQPAEVGPNDSGPFDAGLPEAGSVEQLGPGAFNKGCLLLVNAVSRAFVLQTVLIEGEDEGRLRIISPLEPFAAGDRVNAGCAGNLQTQFTIATSLAESPKQPAELGPARVQEAESSAGCGCGSPALVKLDVTAANFALAVDDAFMAEVANAGGRLPGAPAKGRIRGFTSTKELTLAAPGSGLQSVNVVQLDLAGHVSAARPLAFALQGDEGGGCSVAHDSGNFLCIVAAPLAMLGFLRRKRTNPKL
jgi:hypothetical protein